MGMGRGSEVYDGAIVQKDEMKVDKYDRELWNYTNAVGVKEIITMDIDFL